MIPFETWRAEIAADLESARADLASNLEAWPRPRLPFKRPSAGAVNWPLQSPGLGSIRPSPARCSGGFMHTTRPWFKLMQASSGRAAMSKAPTRKFVTWKTHFSSSTRWHRRCRRPIPRLGSTRIS